MNMEYPYDGNSNQYQLWKPSNGYFPRGEAPPPYEEAVAQANENVSAQCTVRLVFAMFAMLCDFTVIATRFFVKFICQCCDDNAQRSRGHIRNSAEHHNEYHQFDQHKH